MHENSEWGRGMQRTDSYWRPPAGFYYPGSSPGRNWTPNGRFPAHNYSRYSNQYNNRFTDNRSHGIKWQNFHRSQHQDHYNHSYRPGQHQSMAPGHKKGKGRGRGGSRPFPSKLMIRTDNTATSSSTVSSIDTTHSRPSATSASSSTRHSASTSSSVSSSSHQTLSENPSSRPDHKGSRSSQSLKNGKSLHDVKTYSANVPSTPPVSSSFSSSLNSSKDSPSFSSSASSTISSSSQETPKSTQNIAQSYTVSVSSTNLQKMKFFKKSVPSDSDPIPMSTLAYCESIPFLRQILHKKPVVVLERLTERLIRRKLKHAGLHLHGNLHKLMLTKKELKLVQSKGHDKQKNADKYQKKASLKLVLSMNASGVLDRKSHKDKKDSSKHKDIKKDSPDSENILESKDTKTNTSLLVDPKVISLSRPLQTAYSNNSSVTNMPFKTSGRGKNPSKTFHSKPTGPVPRHMQIFDLDKLRTKLKGANFGGSSRKPRPILNIQKDINNAEIIKPSIQLPKTDSVLSTIACNPDSVYDLVTYPADSTKHDLKEDFRDSSGAADISCNADKKVSMQADTGNSDPAVDELISDCRREDVSDNVCDIKRSSVDLKDTVDNGSLDSVSTDDLYPRGKEDSFQQTESNECKADTKTFDASNQCSTDSSVDNKGQNVSSESDLNPEDDFKSVENEDEFPGGVSSPSEDSPDSQSLEKSNETSKETDDAHEPILGNSKDSQVTESYSKNEEERNSGVNHELVSMEMQVNISHTAEKELDLDNNEAVGKGEGSIQSKVVNTVTEVQSGFEDNEQLCVNLREKGDSDSDDNLTYKEIENNAEGCVKEDAEVNSDSNNGIIQGMNVPGECSEGNIHMHGQQEMATKNSSFPQDHDGVSTNELLSQSAAAVDGQNIEETADVAESSNSDGQCLFHNSKKLNSDPISDEEHLDNQSIRSKLNSPSSLKDLCGGILNHCSAPSDSLNCEGTATDSVSAAKATEDSQESELVLHSVEVSGGKEKNDESNSQCLTDIVSDISPETLDMSSTKSDDCDDLSPMCVITHVESGAHIYFSESDSDFKLNPQSIKQEETSLSDEQMNSSSPYHSQTMDNNTTGVINTSDNPEITPGQNTIVVTQQVFTTTQTQVVNVQRSSLSLPSTNPNTGTTVATGIPGLYSPSIATQFPLLLTPTVPVYPIVSSVVQPVLIASPKSTPRPKTSPVIMGAKSANKERKLSPKPRPIKPKGTKPIQVVMAPGHISPGPIFPMFLPTVPSAFPNDSHAGTMESSSKHPGRVSSPDKQKLQKDLEAPRDSDSSPGSDQPLAASLKDSALRGNITSQDDEGSMAVGNTNTESVNPGSHIENEHPDVTGSCVVVQESKGLFTSGLTRMVSDLDVMRYDDEEQPPVLSRINTDLCDRDEGVQLPEIQFIDGSFIAVSAASDTGVTQPVYLTQTTRDPQDLTVSNNQQSSSTVSHNQEYVVLFSGAQAEHDANTVEELERSEVDNVTEKTEPESEDRIEVGRLNLRRAHGEGSDDSDATLIYSCDEDNTCFEEIFQEPVSQSWPRNAPWNENEDEKNPSLYEGKLVIVSDIADDGEADGESTSDTNTSNERLSLIITTLRKDLEEKKSDRRQAGKSQTEEVEENAGQKGCKLTRTKGKRRKGVKSRKRAAAATVVSDDATDPSILARKKPYRKRENLIVTIKRKNVKKDSSVSSFPEQVTESEMDRTVVKAEGTGKAKTNVKKVTKPRRRIKRRLTVKRRKKKVTLPKVETVDSETVAVVSEDVAEGDQTRSKKIPKKIRKICGKKSTLVSKLRGRKKKGSPAVKKEELSEEKAENMTDSDDSDELPTIHPPKRRRLQNNGNPLMMMQNSVGSKGNSSERIMREFPRHNWLEQKINQLQQQASCSPSCEEDLADQSLQQSPTHISPVNLCSDSQEITNLSFSEENVPTNSVPSKPSSPTKDSEDTAGNVCEQDKDAAERNAESSGERDSVSLNDALKLIEAGDSEGQLVIDEGDQDEKGGDSAMNISKPEDLSDTRVKEESKVECSTQQMSLSSEKDFHVDNQPLSEEEVAKSDMKSDAASTNTGTGLPLDLCVRKSDKTSGGTARPKAHPPVQMVLPQIQQPERPVSTDPLLVKETKEIVQNVVVQSSENSSFPVCNESSQASVNEALNLSKVTSGHEIPSDDFVDMIKGVVMPVVTQAETDAEQQRQPENEAHFNDEMVSNTLSTSSSQVHSQSSGNDVSAVSTASQVSSGLVAQSVPTVPPETPTASCESVPSGMPTSVPVSRPMESPMSYGGQLMQGPVPIPTPGGSKNQHIPYPRPGYTPRNMSNNILDKEFEKHLKEFKHLEMLAARKERERETLLKLKKRKAMLLKEMKYGRNQQSGDEENLHGPPPAHNGNQYGIASHFPNTQHRAQVAELRPFQNVAQTMTGQHQAPNLSMYSSPSRMSQTQTSPSINLNSGPFSLDSSNQRKRSSSEDRRPIVQMINLAMLQRGRKQRRLTDDQHRSSGTVPTPAHQNKTEVVMNHDADVPTSEITQCPYVKRKTPILEPPGSVNRSNPASAALIPAHSQQPFQTAGSLIVPVRNGADETIPPSFPSASPHPAGNTVSPAPHAQSVSYPNPVSSVHRTPSMNEIHGDPNAKSRNSTDSAYNILSQDQPMPYPKPGDRNAGNTNPPPYPIEHFGNVQPQWSPRMPNPVSQSARLPLQQNYHGNQSVRQAVAHNLHRPPHSMVMRPERNLDIIDLTKDQEASKNEMIRQLAGTHPMVVGGEPDAETETSVQRELTAALARRQGMTGYEQQQQQQQQQQHQLMRRNQDIPNTAQYNTKPYPSHNPLSPQGMPQVQHSNQMYPPQGPTKGGNPMALPTESVYSMQSRQSAAGSQYRMQESTSVKSALLSHSSKQMMCAPSYPMNTSAPVTSYPAPHYQQQRSMNKVPQQMLNNNPLVEGYPRMPGQVPQHQPPPPGYNDHLTRTGQPMPNQYKVPQQGMNWRPQAPTSVSNVPMSFEKQQQLMMMTRKTQWEQFAQQKHAMAQKSASHSIPSSNPVLAMQTAVSSMPQVPGPNYVMAPAAQGQDHPNMQQRAVMHQHNMRMMQRSQAPIAAQMQAKMQSVAAGYPRETGMMIPGQNTAPALIEFQQQENQRRMPQMPMNQPPPRLHQFNGSCVVCGALAMYLCSSCRMVWYCSQTCQNNHWKRHAPECKPVKPGIPGQL